MDFRGRSIDLVGKQNLWFGISAVVILIGLVAWVTFGLNLGIDFKGGGQLQYLIPAAQRPAAGEDVALLNKVRESLPKELENAKIQISGGDTLVIVTDATNEDSLQSQERILSQALTTQFGAAPQMIGRELVGPVIGKELKRNALLGVFLGVLGIALWIYIRYNYAGDGVRYAVAAISSLIHDVLVLIGLFALIGKIDPRIEVDGAFIAALLTVVGYSINDCVVIFDRIRENMRKRPRDNYNRVVNDSLLETMSRSINTGMTVIIMLVVMLMFGGESIYNFILAMLIGIATGLYSSLFNASMVLTAWNNWDSKKLATAGATGASASGRSLSTPATPRSESTSASAPASRATVPLSQGSNPSTPAAGKPTSASLPAEQRPHKARSKKRF